MTATVPTNAEFTALTTRVTATETHLTTNDTRIAATETHLTTNDTRLTAAETAANALATRVTAVETSSADAASRLSAVETGEGDLRSLVTALTARVEALEDAESETPTDPGTGGTTPPSQASISISTSPVVGTTDSIIVGYLVTNGTVASATFSRDGVDANGTGPWTSDPVTDTQFTFTMLLQQDYHVTVTATLTDGSTLSITSTAHPAYPTGTTTPPATGGGTGGGTTTPPSTSTNPRLASIAMPSIGWFSGGSGMCIDGNDPTFGNWRGKPVTALVTWLDGTDAEGWGWGVLGGSNDGPAANFKGYLDVRIGGPSDWASAAGGSFDARLESMLVQFRKNRTIGGVLYPTSISPAHEFNGSWYDWSVSKGEEANFRATMTRWIAIGRRVFPELLWMFNPNGETTSDCVVSECWVDGFDLYGADRYNQNPYIGTSKTGGYTSWEAGIALGNQSNPIGLAQHVAFAKAHGVPIVLPEYGNNAQDSQNPQQSGDDPYWVNNALAYIKANAGKGPGQFFADMWFNQGGKEEEKWPIYRTDGVAIRGPKTAAAYRAFFQAL